ncbi:MAG: PilZ domain-containing protein [Ruminococcaceae bacterium]|nr:PilZ domain-containing protein [Oscillospiraceae bacterium]
MLLFFGNKIVKVEILDRNGSVAVSAEKGFVFPKNIESDDDSILIIKGTSLREFPKDERVHVVATTKAGDRIKYPGIVTVSLDSQLNARILKNRDTEVLEERRRYFKIKVEEKGRVLFVVRDDETLRFEVPVPMEVLDINIGGVFITSDYVFQQDDMICIDIDLFVDYRLNAVAQVLRVQKDPDGTIKGYGCQFQGLTASQEDYIGKYIYKVQFAQRQKEMAREMDY